MKFSRNLEQFEESKFLEFKIIRLVYLSVTAQKRCLIFLRYIKGKSVSAGVEPNKLIELGSMFGVKTMIVYRFVQILAANIDLSASRLVSKLLEFLGLLNIK